MTAQTVTLTRGTRVVYAGSIPSAHGLRGTVVRWYVGTDRYLVQMDDGSSLVGVRLASLYLEP